MKWKQKLKEKRKGVLCEVYDALYDPSTGEWLEKKCSDTNCSYCKNRPPKHPDNCKCKKESNNNE